MNRLLTALLLCAGLASCGPQQPVYTTSLQQPAMVSNDPQYQVLTSPGGAQQVAFYDNGVQQVMEYAMFMSLMNSGGYTNVIHHYHEPYYHARVYDNRSYGSWSRRNSTPTAANTRIDGTSTRQQGSFGSGQVKQTNTTWRTTSTAVPAPKTSWKTTTTTSSYKPSSSSTRSSGGFGGGRRK